MTENLEKEILLEVEKKLFLLDEELQEKKEDILKIYRENISKVLENIINLQRKKEIGIIGTFSFFLSRVEIDNENFYYHIYLYGEKVYIDTYNFIQKLDVSFFYKYIKEIKKEALLFSKKYITENIRMPELEREIYHYLKYFNMYIVNILREIFQEKRIIQQLEEIEKTEDFSIIQGEIYEQPYWIYSNSDKKDRK